MNKRFLTKDHFLSIRQDYIHQSMIRVSVFKIGQTPPIFEDNFFKSKKISEIIDWSKERLNHPERWHHDFYGLSVN